MLLAELEIWHSRPIAPTRRVALGRGRLPADPAPGFGGILLGGIVAAHIGELDLDLTGELGRLITDLEAGRRIPQPRLRHRFQVDHIGLARSRHRLHGHGDALDFEFDDQGSAASQILGAVYAGGMVHVASRPTVMATLRRAARWQGPVGPALVAHLAGARAGRSHSAAALVHPRQWALGVLGFLGDDHGIGDGDDLLGPDAPDLLGLGSRDGGRHRDEGGAPVAIGSRSPATPAPTAVQRRFRELLRAAHPDHGGPRDAAAQRIADLTEARRILLAVVR